MNIETPPTDFSLRYEWQEGSVPPPYHWEYSIRLGPGLEGEVILTPDYPQHHPPVWRETFTMTGEQVAALYALLVKQRVLTRKWQAQEGHSVGGSLAWLSVDAADAHVSVPAHLQKKDALVLGQVAEAIRALTPADLWSRLLAQRDAYQEEYLAKRELRPGEHRD